MEESLALVAKIFCISRCIGLTNLYMVILLTVLAFLLCGLPFGIYWFLLIWIGNHSEPLFCNLYSVSVVLSAINSSINPIIYFLVGSFRKRQWRCQWQTLRLVLQGALQDTPEVDKHGGNVQQEALEMTRSSLV
ncbi:Mas-related G-protein coupled receptor member X2 [Tupaia chinensis]|uniref:Mas-related G-protein coupled receptor member X2 n=1 Tax=Tupaia chinensis TaxID=246437 RepID=L8YBG3_TUPCH|nr:Mas-related G-protein coupled receptor member X2 [Tupaia chinensis]